MISKVLLNKSLSHEGSIIKSSLNSFYKDITSDKYSIKIPLNGSEHYKVNSQSYVVHNNNYLITNPFQETIAEIDSKNQVDGLCIYINPEILQDVFFSSKHLFIDEDAEYPLNSPLILEHSYASDYDELGIFINTIKRDLSSIKSLESEDFFYNLSKLILLKRVDVHFQYSKIEALKTSTKKELYKRLNIMYQIIRTHFKESISLSELSSKAGLSKFHAVRLYKRVYGISPYNHIQKLRLEESTLLLKHNTITETSYLLGFSDRRAFSKAFRKHFGISPTEYLKLSNSK